jgi:hypothetical protein
MKHIILAAALLATAPAYAKTPAVDMSGFYEYLMSTVDGSELPRVPEGGPYGTLATERDIAIATPARARDCADWRNVDAADTARLEAIAKLSAAGRTGAHKYLFSEVLLQGGDDDRAALADGCGKGAR